MTDFMKLLEESFEVEKDICECPPESRLEYLACSIFDFTTYDSEMSVLFARKAVEVSVAITSGTTFQYIEEPENYRWFLIMCNMPFFQKKLDWGTSIRGAWWGFEILFRSTGLWGEKGQFVDEVKFTQDEWKEFMTAVAGFALIEP